jgi:hypothetical protein
VAARMQDDPRYLEAQIYVEIDTRGKPLMAEIHKSSGNKEWDETSIRRAMREQYEVAKDKNPPEIRGLITIISNDNSFININPRTKIESFIAKHKTIILIIFGIWIIKTLIFGMKKDSITILTPITFVAHLSTNLNRIMGVIIGISAIAIWHSNTKLETFLYIYLFFIIYGITLNIIDKLTIKNTQNHE